MATQRPEKKKPGPTLHQVFKACCFRTKIRTCKLRREDGDKVDVRRFENRKSVPSDIFMSPDSGVASPRAAIKKRETIGARWCYGRKINTNPRFEQVFVCLLWFGLCRAVWIHCGRVFSPSIPCLSWRSIFLFAGKIKPFYKLLQAARLGNSISLFFSRSPYLPLYFSPSPSSTHS